MSRKQAKVERPRSIAVEGPVGVGKSVLARALVKRLGARAAFEEPDQNPFLKEFYRDPRQFAFQTQTFFLLSRYKQQVELKQEELFRQSTVSDYIFQKDRIFAYLTLEGDELALYDRVYSMLDPRLPVPDFVVYLQARPEVLLERIRIRNRAGEKGLAPSFLEKVAKAYNDYFFRYDRTPLLVVNTSEIDLAGGDRHLDDVTSAVLRMRKGVQHYNPYGRS